MPTQRCKHTTMVVVSSTSSSSCSSITSSSSISSGSGSGTSSNGDTSSESITTSDDKDGSLFTLDEGGWSNMSLAVYMLSELEEFELKD